MHRPFSFLFAAGMTLALALLTGCDKKAATAQKPVFVKDDVGIVRRVNPDEKNVYLVFTAHYSENDNGCFENFDGVVSVLNTLKEKGVIYDVKGFLDRDIVDGRL